jgi:hypothetical protein
MDHDDGRFFHISVDERILKTDKYVHHQRLEDVITWDDENNIVVLTKKTIHLHEIRYQFPLSLSISDFYSTELFLNFLRFFSTLIHSPYKNN